MNHDGINYDKWQKMDLWELWQGLCLILGKEPRQSEFERRRDSFPQFWNRFDEIAEMAEASFLCNTLKFHTTWPDNLLYRKVVPTIFLAWAKKKGFEIHESFLALTQEEVRELNTKILIQKTSAISKSTLRQNQAAKLICQGIARTLWDIYPDMTIEDMKKHHAILEYGGGKHYAGKNTLRDWLSPVDPRPPTKKTGRPAKC